MLLSDVDSYDDQIEEVIRMAKDDLLTVYGQSSSEGTVWSGSGFYISGTDWIATCAHVVDSDMDGETPEDLELSGVDFSGKRLSLQVLSIALESDLALLVESRT